MVCDQQSTDDDKSNFSKLNEEGQVERETGSSVILRECLEGSQWGHNSYPLPELQVLCQMGFPALPGQL